METLLQQHNILSVIVPSSCTDLLQPLYLSVNKPLKDHLRSCCQSWHYSEQVSKQLEGGKEPEGIKVDTKLTVVKPLSARWIISAYDCVRSQSWIIYSGFVEAGIVAALESDDKDEIEDEDPFQDLD